MKHDELLKLEKKLKTEYLENLAALDDPHDCSLSNMAFYEKKLREIEAEAQKHDLKRAFMTYDGYRQTLIYKDLIFVNQTVGGGWEAWTLKRFGDELIDFESISMQHIIENGKTHDGLTFEQYIEKLQAMTREQCENYLQNCLKTK